jgi:hypothetical protein
MATNLIDSLALDAAIEIERFAAFDHPTRRFIAHALAWVPDLALPDGSATSHAGNPPQPLLVPAGEQAERACAYAALPNLRGCAARGPKGQRERRLHFGDLLAMAKVDLRWKRLTGMPAFIFCYERLAGPAWRQLLIPCWMEAVHQRRRRGAAQLPLDRRLRDDQAVPNSLEDDPEPLFYPSMADADAFGAPLLAGL